MEDNRTAYDKAKSGIKKYFDKCTRLQIMLNPSNPDDAALIAFLDGVGDPDKKGKTAKAILKRYMRMQEALKDI